MKKPFGSTFQFLNARNRAAIISEDLTTFGTAGLLKLRGF